MWCVWCVMVVVPCKVGCWCMYLGMYPVQREYLGPSSKSCESGYLEIMRCSVCFRRRRCYRTKNKQHGEYHDDAPNPVQDAGCCPRSSCSRQTDRQTETADERQEIPMGCVHSTCSGCKAQHTIVCWHHACLKNRSRVNLPFP